MNYVQPIRDPKKIQEMQENLSPRDAFMFTLGINVGCRISDLLPLRVKDLRGKKHLIIDEKKTGKRKRFLINNQLQAVINEYTKDMKDDSFLFPSRKKGFH